MDDLFERGFRTKNGSIRTLQSIQSYATLATIIFQTNQNEQHGGQAIPASVVPVCLMDSYLFTFT